MLQVWPYKDKKRKEKKRKGTCEHTTSRLFKWAPKAQDPVASHMGLRSRPRFRTCRRVTLWDRGPRGEGPGWRETQPSCCPAGAGPAPGLRCRLPIQEGAPWPARAVCPPAARRCPERAGVCCSPTQCRYLVPRGNTAQAHTLFVLVLLSCLALCVSRAFLCTEVPEQCSRCVLAAGRLSPREGAHDISPLRWHHWN